MRKLFLFLCAALMSVGMFATTVVTITDSDFPAWAQSFTKDGVTVSAEMIDGMYGNIGGPGSFSTTLGNFTQIEVNAMDVNISGEGWSGNSEKMTWTGNASSVSFTGDINGDEEGLTLKFTIEPAAAPATVAVTGVTLDQNEAQMTVGETLTLTPTVLPGNATNKDVMWTSDNGYVATIENGVITAEGEGTATITVTTVDGEYTATCAVTVTAATPEPEPEPAGDEITVTWNDPSGYGFEFTQDGVTLTCGEITYKDFYGPGTFTTELGNFTKIEVYAEGGCLFSGDGWSGDDNQKTWTGNAASVSFSYDIYVPTSIVFTIEPASTPEPQNTNVNVEGGQDPQNTTYYYSTFFDSQVKYLLPEGVEAYVATISDDALTLTRIAVAGQTIPANNAVIFRATDENITLTPSTADAVTFTATNSLKGVDEVADVPANCYVLSDEDGKIGFYAYNGNQLNAHKAYITYDGGSGSGAPRRMRFIFAEEQTATGAESATTNVESRKVIENGQLVIIHGGVRYNAAGQVIE